MSDCPVIPRLNQGERNQEHWVLELGRCVSRPTSMYVTKTNKAISNRATSDMPGLRSRKVESSNGFEAVSVLQALLDELSV